MTRLSLICILAACLLPGFSTKPVGPIVCPRNPVLFKTPYRGPGNMTTWQVEVASADQDDTVVWRSNPVSYTHLTLPTIYSV